MCGITGIIQRRGAAPPRREDLERMTEKLFHRGPDESGYYVTEKVGFGFRRLAILDLEGGHQPLFNEDRSLVLVGNGEIFNYRELRRELSQKGHSFSTQGDIETILHLYEEYGKECVKKLNGQFAFALYDLREERLFLARDHVGIAPLFFTTAGDAFLFASEIKALLAHPAVAPSLDLVGLDQLFTFPGVVSPRTMFEGIEAVQPGHWVEVTAHDIRTVSYWDIFYPKEREVEQRQSEEYYLERLDEVLQQAVKERLLADVPLGYYLSGGLDSSLIAALIHTLSPNEGRDSFSITFADSALDESRYQQIVSKKFGSRHHALLFNSEDILKRLRTAVYHAETPLKESYNTCSLALSEAVRSHGIKVVLSGEGADELFAGYVGYRFDEQGREEDTFDPEVALEQDIRYKVFGDKTLLYERNFLEFEEIKQGIYSEEVRSTFDQFNCLRHPLIDKSKLFGRHKRHKRSYLDFKFRVSDHLLADHGDRVALANSTEARYPFLDKNVIEFVATIPPEFLLREGVEKYLLKKYARKYLPDEIIQREKFSFVAPGSSYLLRQQVEWVNDLLSYEMIKRQKLFDPKTVERLKIHYSSEGFSINQTFDNDLLMIVLTTGIFLQEFYS